MPSVDCRTRILTSVFLCLLTKAPLTSSSVTRLVLTVLYGSRLSIVSPLTRKLTCFGTIYFLTINNISLNSALVILIATETLLPAGNFELLIRRPVLSKITVPLVVATLASLQSDKTCFSPILNLPLFVGSLLLEVLLKRVKASAKSLNPVGLSSVTSIVASPLFHFASNKQVLICSSQAF